MGEWEDAEIVAWFAPPHVNSCPLALDVLRCVQRMRGTTVLMGIPGDERGDLVYIPVKRQSGSVMRLIRA